MVVEGILPILKIAKVIASAFIQQGKAMRSVAEKLGAREGQRAYFLDAPEDARATIEYDGLVISQTLRGTFDVIFAFVIDQRKMRAVFPKLRAHLKPGGRLWLCWPKGRRLNSDLTVQTVISIGYDYNMVESKAVSIDGTWSALKFTFPRPQTIYVNSYGTLP
jgi:hypothetical protein